MNIHPRHRTTKLAPKPPVAVCCGGFRNVAGGFGGNFVALQFGEPGGHAAGTPHRLAPLGLAGMGSAKGLPLEAKSPMGWLRHFDLLTYTDGLCLNFNIML